MILKINNEEYTITKTDVFLHEGKQVQLLTQSKEPAQGGRHPNPVLNHWAVKRLRKAGVTEKPSKQYDGIEIRLK